jgi:nucleoside 2-deoxyribosyltransferase
MKIYVASSWRNLLQPAVVQSLRKMGHEVYDFKSPRPGDNGFSWKEIDGGWQNWTMEQYVAALDHPVAIAGFNNDWGAMLQADACVMVMPCGRSAHIEAGYFVGAKKPLYILQIEAAEAELMYKMATKILTKYDSLLEVFSEDQPSAS